MSFDLFQDETNMRISRAAQMPSLAPEPGFFGGFGRLVMKGAAEAAGTIDLLVKSPLILSERLFGDGDTTQQDWLFQRHDEMITNAVDYWTPRPEEVGTGGRILGGLVSGLGQLIVSPALAIATAQTSLTKELFKKNIDRDKAITAGIAAGTGLGAGIAMPILGNTLAQRVILGGMLGNVAQGVATRAAIGQVLKGTEAAKDFNPWDKESILLDGLMGSAFGGLRHWQVSKLVKEWNETSGPDRQRLWARMSNQDQTNILRNDFGQALSETDKAAILVANQARHIEDTTAPGVPVDAAAQTAHADAIKKAVDDLLSGRQVNVEQSLQGVEFRDNAEKVAAQMEVVTQLREEARASVNEAILQNEVLRIAEDTPGFLRTPEQMLALKAGQNVAKGADDLVRAVEIANKPGFLRSAEEKLFLDTVLKGNAFEELGKEIKPIGEPTAPQGTLRRAVEEAAHLPYAQQADAIGKALEAHLVKLGMPADEAGVNAAVWRATVKGLFETDKIPPAELLMQYGLDVLRSGESLPGALDQPLPARWPTSKIGLFETADKSTFQHETGHFFLQVVRDLASRPGASSEAMARWSTIAKWLGVEGGEITRAQHEQWTEGWETYLAKGEAPTPALKSVFQKFRDWMLEIYKTLTGRVEFSPEVKAEVDKMLASSERDPSPPARSDIEAAPRSGMQPSAKNARGATPQSTDPVIAEAQARLTENPDLSVEVGRDADGKAVTQKLSDQLAEARAGVDLAHKDAGLMEIAAACLLGGA